MNNFTILIQGPLHDNGINNLKYYKSLCDVIISTWENPLLEKLKGEKYIYQPHFEPTCFNRGNIYFQTITSLNGLNAVNTENVIKIRCDEYFTNLNPIFESVINNPNKLTCSNIMLNKYYPLTMSDHIIAGKTKFIKGMFERVKKICERLPANDKPPQPHEIGLEQCTPITEVILFSQFLREQCIYPNIKNTVNLWRENLNIIDISKLGKFEIKCNTNGQSFNRVEDVIAVSDNIRSVEDLCAEIRVA